MAEPSGKTFLDLEENLRGCMVPERTMHRPYVQSMLGYHRIPNILPVFIATIWLAGFYHQRLMQGSILFLWSERLHSVLLRLTDSYIADSIPDQLSDIASVFLAEPKNAEFIPDFPA